MTFPIEIAFGEFSINAHIIFETLAFIIGFQYFMRLKRTHSDPISESNRIWIIIGAAFGAFLFSRLLGSLENPEAWHRSDYPWLYFYSSKTIVGGLLGGLFTVEVTKYFLNEKSSSGDLFTFPLILAMILGRIGCFTAGVYEPTFGIESNLPWAMNLGDGLMRHPVALYEIIFLVVLWIFLSQLEKYRQFEGGIRFKFFMIAYLIFRFLLDFIKPTHAVLLNLSSIQLACLGGLLYYTRTLFFIFYNPRKLILHAK
ncbi:prolipoprotein diacylglyceryl transferase family protein [Chryseolinea sp. H1M3-3]|uniref:prolipoprotein diacylglyceryl transferase n=1 Tax=Chryseolinea sp. H1M3-3 TaxID=3034144 RepID=UPI0023EE260A|nr:prolipoprotein diacylglyceryl transferase family protein [Chryseolinea sp. H1M3-3]